MDSGSSPERREFGWRDELQVNSKYLEAVTARIHCYVILPFKCHFKGSLAGAFKAAV